MILDNQEQKDLLLAMINGWNLPGNMIEKFYELKMSIQSAEIKSG